ncbi:rhodanese domain protein [Chondrocystis sp. NIES-4102]|nr:rhodanese domain protein [Chondrocystis sp. NIES-4102]
MKKTEYLVDSEWLAQNLDNPEVVIIDCRFQLGKPNWGQEQYDASHIQGAFYLDLEKDLSSKVERHGGRHPLPDVDILSKKFSELGIVKNQTLVVAYDDARFAFASRLWWLLRHLGHDTVVLLDGGWQDWVKHNYPVSNVKGETKPGSFIAQPSLDWIVDINQVKSAQNQDTAIIIDSRSRDRYAGISEPIDPVAGSIPGAINCFWQDISDESGYLKPHQEQQDLWQDLKPGSEVIVYCGSGVTACVNLFSLAIAGINNTKLYPGGWSDWCSYLLAED